jgi:hypothetical protein
VEPDEESVVKIIRKELRLEKNVRSLYHVCPFILILREKRSGNISHCGHAVRKLGSLEKISSMSASTKTEVIE